jgi:hypothetical protein
MSDQREQQQQSWIEQLNSVARRYEENGMSAYDAVEQAASEFKLSVVAEGTMEGDTCRLYETPDGTMVNCWIDELQPARGKAREQRFDSRIGWFTRKG